MNDLISRSALLVVPNVCKVTEYDESGCGISYLAVSVGDIEAAPAVDAVEVIRCADCIHGRVCRFEVEEPEIMTCIHKNMFPLRVSPGFYCAHGTKMDAEVET